MSRQTSSGVTIQTPSDFVEYSPAKCRNATAGPGFVAVTNCQEFCATNKIPYSELFFANGDGTRVWQLKASKEATKKSYVLEMAISVRTLVLMSDILPVRPGPEPSEHRPGLCRLLSRNARHPCFHLRGLSLDDTRR